jgi:hypothetical protein
VIDDVLDAGFVRDFLIDGDAGCAGIDHQTAADAIHFDDQAESAQVLRIVEQHLHFGFGFCHVVDELAVMLAFFLLSFGDVQQNSQIAMRLCVVVGLIAEIFVQKVDAFLAVEGVDVFATDVRITGIQAIGLADVPVGDLEIEIGDVTRFCLR